MTAPISSIPSLSSAWEVLTLFLIPIGGGIPGGVLLAKSKGIQWPLTITLYFISDVILACLFEPIMLLVVAASKRSVFLTRLREALKKSMAKSTRHYGTSMGPIALILIAFGIDPMTGRAAAVAAGHGFLTGWALVIVGDMLYFLLLMASTLWLSNILGDGTWATMIILVAMMVIPAVVRRLRERYRAPPTEAASISPQ